MKICDVREGDKLWYSELTYGTTRCRVNTPPKEVLVERINSRALCPKGTYIYLYDTDERDLECVGLFKTYEGAKDYYNVRIQNEIDRLMSGYEKAVRNLKSKIIK